MTTLLELARRFLKEHNDHLGKLGPEPLSLVEARSRFFDEVEKTTATKGAAEIASLTPEGELAEAGRKALESLQAFQTLLGSADSKTGPIIASEIESAIASKLTSVSSGEQSSHEPEYKYAPVLVWAWEDAPEEMKAFADIIDDSRPRADGTPRSEKAEWLVSGKRDQVAEVSILANELKTGSASSMIEVNDQVIVITYRP